MRVGPPREEPRAVRRDERGDVARKRVRIRLMVAIPVVTALPLVVLGIVVSDMAKQGVTARQVVQVGPVMTAFTIASVIAILAGIALAYAITSRIAWLTARSKEVARGDISKSVDMNLAGEVSDEIGLLGDAFNEMLSSLSNYILGSMTGGVMTVDERGTVTSLNPSAEIVLGREANEAVGRPLAEVFGSSPSDREFLQAVLAAVRDRQTCQSSEVEFRRGSERLTVRLSTSLLRDERRTMVGVVVTFKDVTQVNRIREQMQRAERLAAIGMFATGVAHNIRNPLAALQGLAQVLDGGFPAGHLRKRYTRGMVTEVKRIDRIVEDLLCFAQPSSGKFEETDVNAVVRNAVAQATESAASACQGGVQIHAEDLPPILAEEDRLLWALSSLIRNALEAIEERGTVEVRTTATDGAVRVEVSNDGPTIPPDQVDRIFAPFFTTKRNCTGLGLAVVNQIVAAHEGELYLDNQPGKVTFGVVLPSHRPEGRNG